MTEDDLRWDTGGALRGLLPDVDRARLEVEADSGVPRGVAGGPMRDGLAVDKPARTPILELSDFLIGVSVALGFMMPIAEPGLGLDALGVVNATDWRREPKSGRPIRVGTGVEPPVPFTPILRLS